MLVFDAAVANWPPLFEQRIADLTPLVLFALWAVVLAILLAFGRFYAVFREKRTLNTFKPSGDTEQLDAFSRAHLNALENLPIFAVVYSVALYAANTPIVGLLGWIVLLARIGQSIVHVSSRSNLAVGLRAALQLVQLTFFIWLGVLAISWANAPRVVT